MKLVVASNNKGKIKELSEILTPYGFEVVSQTDAGYNLDVEETGTTFEENSYLKAKALYDVCSGAVIADDSGLEVDYLDKAPGIYSARYVSADATNEERYNQILKELNGVDKDRRTARFVCVITYISDSGDVHHFRGECEGYIGFEPRGRNGFGYDPIFCIGDRTMSELSEEEKNRISHRGRAIKQLTDFLNKENI